MSKKQTILIIGPTPPPYHGVAQATQALLNSKLINCFKIVHLDTSDRRGIEYVDKPDIHDVFLFLKQWFLLLKSLITFHPRIVYIPLSQSTIGFLRDGFFIWPAVLSGGRVVLHLHGGNFRNWYEKRPRLIKTYTRLVLKRVAKIIVLGESLRVNFHDLAAPEKISVVPNGIPWSNDPVSRDKWPAETGRYRVIYLGTLNHHKGVLVMLSSISFVVTARQDVEFVFAGGWSDDHDRIEAGLMIAKRNLAPFVSFVGLVEGKKKEDLLISSDIFVFPGVQQEGQPLVVLEAMAAGLPVLFTNRGCLRETVKDGENGLEILPDNPYDLAAKLLELLDHPLKIKQMGEQSRLRYEKIYTIDRFTENMVSVFNDISRSHR